MNKLKLFSLINRDIMLNSMVLKLEVAERANHYDDACDFKRTIIEDLKDLFHYFFGPHKSIKFKESITLINDEPVIGVEKYIISVEARVETLSDEALLNEIANRCRNLHFNASLSYYFTVNNRKELLLDLEQEAYRNTIEANRIVMQRDNINPTDIIVVSYPVKKIQTEEYQIPHINEEHGYITTNYVPWMLAEVSCCIVYKL